ncbi:hypothetical protein EHP00_1018 [Ecytonucleospora hepatopenaei]|uniref:Uncharacterized protein n=1 Tax=Ecytonucleospora hepatopenaei TaxID=646526 RepID=A0A1W0E538_9MICR|nr:hypothetical protein EHP00_1018 [Ecytonucleospora hepatopenaei]
MIFEDELESQINKILDKITQISYKRKILENKLAELSNKTNTETSKIDLDAFYALKKEFIEIKQKFSYK